jgi:hypothetical protein
MRRALPFVLALALAACGEILSAPDTAEGQGSPNSPNLVANEAAKTEDAASAADPTVTPAIAPPSPSPTATPTGSSTATTTATTPPPPPPPPPSVDAGCVALEHDNGVGQTYTSCSPLGTYDEASAMLACRAFVAAGGGIGCLKLDGSFPCSFKTVYSYGQASGQPHAVWDYASVNAGHVVLYVGTAAACPSSTNPTWN